MLGISNSGSRFYFLILGHLTLKIPPKLAPADGLLPGSHGSQSTGNARREFELSDEPTSEIEK